MQSRLNRIFRCMKNRCYNPKHQSYKYYGAIGITICDEWLNNEKVKKGKAHSSYGWLTFEKWALENGYADNLTIDRIDISKGYSPSNCRWVTQKEQANNKRNNRIITYKGRTQTLAQWCDELNLNYDRIQRRIVRDSFTIERAFETKIRSYKCQKKTAQKQKD